MFASAAVVVLWSQFKGLRSHRRVPHYKTKKIGQAFLNKTLFCQMPGTHILARWPILLNIVRSGVFSGAITNIVITVIFYYQIRSYYYNERDYRLKTNTSRPQRTYNRLQTTNFTGHNTNYTLHTTLHTTACIIHTTHYTLHTTHYTLHYTLHTTHNTLHTTHYTLHLWQIKKKE